MSYPITLHIGLPKTASTFLQDEVFPRLAEHAFIDRPRARSLSKIRAPDAGFFFERALAREPGIWDDIGAQLLDELLGDERGARPVLVSDEAIGRAGSHAARLSGHLAAFDRIVRQRGFSGLQVIVVIREQASWLASHYAQRSDRMSRAGQRAFERFVLTQTDPFGGFYRFGSLLQYDVLYDALSSALPTNDLLVLPFEDLSQDRSAFISALTAFLGDDTGDPAGFEERNVRKTAPAHWSLRQPPLLRPRAWARYRLGGESSRAIHLTPELRKRCAVFAAGNAEVMKATGLDLGRRGYAV